MFRSRTNPRLLTPSHPRICPTASPHSAPPPSRRQDESPSSPSTHPHTISLPVRTPTPTLAPIPPPLATTSSTAFSRRDTTPLAKIAPDARERPYKPSEHPDPYADTPRPSSRSYPHSRASPKTPPLAPALTPPPRAYPRSHIPYRKAKHGTTTPIYPYPTHTPYAHTPIPAPAFSKVVISLLYYNPHTP